MNSNNLPETFQEHKGISYVGITTCFICHDGAGHIFMAKRSNEARDEQGTWDIGGGGLDLGLSAKDNVIKEVQEEYAAAAQSVDFLGYRDVFRTLPTGQETHWLALDFLVKVDPDEVRINEPHKFDDSGWFTLDTMPKPLHSQLPYVLDKHADELRKVLEAS
ncbi:MAG TPA: NUDIX domain-containing protein [Candidatus Saccharimonadales bacterium]|nr:NUDIX domain-containing protein [Candidatus Saccharimonadales bacterium]